MIKPNQPLNKKIPFSPLPLALAIGTSTLMMSASVAAQKPAAVQENVVIMGQEKERYLVEKPSSVKFTQKMLDTPKTINVVTEEVLSDQGVTSLNDALRNVAGVSTFGAGEGGGGNITTSDVVTIRGFDSNGSIYSDGIRDVAGYSRDTFNTEQIEVAKGSSSSIYGKGSAGGTVNLVSKKANLNGNKKTIDVSYDEGKMGRLTADINHVISEDSAFRLNALVSSGGDYLDNGAEKYKTLALAPSFYTKISEKTDMSINLMYMKQDNTPMLGLPYVLDNVSKQTGLPVGPLSEDRWDNYYGVKGLDFEKVNTLSGTLVINHEINDQWSLRSQTRLAKSDRDAMYTRAMFQDNRVPGGPHVYTDRINPIQRTRDEFEESRLFVTQLDAIGEIQTGQIKHNIVIGAEVYKESLKVPKIVSNFSITPGTLDFINPPETATLNGSWSKNGYAKNIDGRGAAIYIVDTATLNKNWQIGGGLRYEHYKVSGGQNVWLKKPSGWTQIPYSSSAKSNFISWHASLNYKPVENGSIYFSVSNAQQPPGSDMAFSGYRSTQIESANNLDPLESTNIELGTKWSIADERLLLGAAIFNTTKEEYDSINRTYIEGGEKRTRGLELSASGMINENLNISATYAYQDAKVTEKAGRSNEGDGLTAAPKNSGNIWLNYQSGPWSLAGGLEYSSGNEFWRRNRAFFKTPSATLVNAMAAYNFNDDLRLQLNVSNLTDKAYITDFSAKGHFKPGTPRNIKLGLNYNF